MKRDKELSNLVFEQFIRPEVLSDVDVEMRTALVPLACVRLFDSTMMAAVLKVTEPNVFGKWRQDRFHELLLKSRTTQLMVWNNGYALNADLRHLITSYLRDNKPRMYRAAHSAALGVYGDRLKRQVDIRSLYVREVIFHRASLGQEDRLETVLKEELKRYSSFYRDPHQKIVEFEKMQRWLTEDHELQSITGQVPSLIEMVQSWELK